MLIAMTRMLPSGLGCNCSVFPSEQCKTVGLTFEESQITSDKIAGKAEFLKACLSTA
jgi:hypothetical protein